MIIIFINFLTRGLKSVLDRGVCYINKDSSAFFSFVNEEFRYVLLIKSGISKESNDFFYRE